MAQDTKRNKQTRDEANAKGTDGPRPPSLSARLEAASQTPNSKSTSSTSNERTKNAKPFKSKGDSAKKKQVIPPALPPAMQSEKPNSTKETDKAVTANKSKQATSSKRSEKTTSSKTSDKASSAIANGTLPPPIPSEDLKTSSGTPPPPLPPSLAKNKMTGGAKLVAATQKIETPPITKDNLARKLEPVAEPISAEQIAPPTAKTSDPKPTARPPFEASKPTSTDSPVSSADLAESGIPPELGPASIRDDEETSDKPQRVSRREARRRPAGPVRERLAANDDAPSIGGLIYALQQKPSTKPFQYAAIGSIVWAVLGATALWFVLSAQPDPLSSALEKPSTFLMITAIALPIVVTWFLALLAWRSEELRLRSSTMAEVAIRLAEPDRLAEQSAASLGQAVRRQVSFMNDAVSRALGRAGELEALVHNEVSALERSYDENERKIRGLIDELSGERTALLRTSDDVHTTLQSLGTEIPTLIEKLSTQQFKLAEIIEGAGDNLTMLETSLSQGTRQLETSIGSRTEELQSVLENYTGGFEDRLDTRTEKLQGILEGHAGRVETTLQSYTGQVDNSLHKRTEQLQTVLDSYTVAVDGALHARTDQMHAMLSDHTKSLGATLTESTQHIDTTLDSRGSEMRTMLEDHSGLMGKSLGETTAQMQGMLENYTSGLAEALASRTEDMQQAFQGYMLTLDNSISNRTDNLQSVFEEYARALDTTLASRAHALDAQLVERTHALDNAFNDRLRLFDQTIVRTTAAIDEAVGEKAVALTTALDSHAQNFRDTITRQTANIDDTLTHGISAVRRSSENVTRQSLKAIEGLASQSDLLKRVSENLLGQINSVTNRFENQGQLIMQAANALESANYKIDTTLKQRHGEMSGTLDRLSSKADEFSQFIEGYSNTIETQLSEAEGRAKAAAEELRQGAHTHKSEAIADLERFRVEAGEESQRALTDLRERFSTVSEEVTSQLGNLSDRFDETTDEVRARAQIATQAIEEEQTRLKQKMETIPANTRESAEAMRRALQDQLTALDQLSQMTSSEARKRDITSPAQSVDTTSKKAAADPASLTARYDREAHSERAETERQLSSLSSSLAQELHARPLRPAGATNKPTGAAPQQPTPAPADTKSSNQPAQQAGRSTRQDSPPRGSAQRAPKAQGATPQAQGDGWSLGDLLKRASLEEEGASTTAPAKPAVDPSSQKPAAAIKTLPDIGLMVQAIDPSTAQEIWNRLRAGQRGIMVPSLYPPPARAAFEELGRRYRTEPPLREAIGRFLADFERTIRAAEQKDPSGRLVQTHLLSEMGRAYLFLAHVSGRLDS